MRLRPPVCPPPRVVQDDFILRCLVETPPREARDLAQSYSMTVHLAVPRQYASNPPNTVHVLLSILQAGWTVAWSEGRSVGRSVGNCLFTESVRVTRVGSGSTSPFAVVSEPIVLIVLPPPPSSSTSAVEHGGWVGQVCDPFGFRYNYCRFL